MRKWLATKQAAWGEAIVCIATGGLATYLNPKIGIPVLVVLLLIFGFWLMWRAYKQQPLVKEGVNIAEVLNQHLQPHWDMLADIARKAVLEIPLPLTSSFGPSFEPAPPKVEYWPIFNEEDRGSEEILHAMQFEHGITWHLNDQNQIQLQIEHDSPLYFSCLITHLV